MPASNNISSYADIDAQLKQARAMGGAEIIFASRAEATVWRARAYYYRKLLRRLEEAKHPETPGIAFTTPWDDMLLRIDKANPFRVRVEFGMKMSGTLQPLSGASDLVPMPEVEGAVGIGPASILPTDDLSDEEVLRQAAALLGPK